MRESNLELEIKKIITFIRNYVASSGLSNVIIGLSGGVDSSLSATLSVQALGKEHVYGVMLPWKNSSPTSYDDALSLAQWLGINHEKVDITPLVEAYLKLNNQQTDNIRLGNWMARMRMCVLYDLSAKYQGLVVGTSNRTELLVGYFTQYGDGACAFEPIGHLYKTEVWAMAKLLGIPQMIIEKTPTADLWTNQTDEGELGILYSELDEILYSLTELNKTPQSIISEGFTSDKVLKVINLIQRSEFKRKMPPFIYDWMDV